MELWVRSQDKKDLVKVNTLWIMDNQIWMEVPFYENHKKLGLTVTGHNHKLAEYKTKERALEVLDEIQEILKPKTIIKFNEKEVYDEKENMVISTLFPYETFDIKQLSTYVYEMPKD